MIYTLKLNTDKKISALINGQKYTRNVNTFAVNDGEAVLLEVFDETDQNNPVRIASQVIIGSGNDPLE